MTPPPPPPPAAAPPLPQDAPPTDDDGSVATTMAGNTTGTLDPDLIELTLRFEFDPKTTAEAKAVAHSHAMIILAIKDEFDEDVTIFNNKGKEVKLDRNHVGPAFHQRNFKMHKTEATKNRKAKHFVIHRFHSTLPLSTIKGFNTVHALLKKTNCYIKHHYWPEDVFNLSTPGYYLGVNPQHYTPDATKQIIIQQISAKHPNLKIPDFRLVYSSPNITHNSVKERTKAHAIEIQRTDTTVMIRLLKDTFKGTCQLLLARLRYQHQQAFVNALKMQSILLNSHFVIPLFGISNEALKFIGPYIKTMPGVVDVTSTKKTATEGKFLILVEKSKIVPVRNQLKAEFQHVYESTVPESVQRAHTFDEEPHVSTRQDDESSGAQSFMSLSVASFSSFATTDEPAEFEMSPSATQTYSSWADMVASPRSPTPNISEVPKTSVPPTVSVLTSESAMISSLQAQVKALQTERQQEREERRKELSEINKALEQQRLQTQAFMTQLLDAISLNNSTESTFNQDETMDSATDIGDTRKRGAATPTNNTKRASLQDTPTKDFQ